MSVPMILELSIDDTTNELILLLASSPSRSIPALIFTRPFSIIPNAGAKHLKLEKFDQLFQRASDEDGADGKQKKPQLNTSTYDFQYGAIDLGPGLEALRREMHLKVTYQEKVTFLEISAELRQHTWTRFATEPNEYREALMTLCLLTMLSLPVPYTEPLWEMTSFACKDVISTTLIPFLSTLSAPSDFYPDLITEERYCILVFHLTNLSFVLDDTHWRFIFGTPKSSDFKAFLTIHQQMSHLLNVSSSELYTQKLKDPGGFSLPQASLHVSLIGFTISQITWKSSIPDTWECYESWRSWWSANSPFRTTSLEDIAYAIVYPEGINLTDLTNRLPPQLTCALAVGLRCSGHLETSSDLLDFSLTFDSSEMYSHVFGMLFAELIKLLTILDRAQDALVRAVAYLQETGTSHSYVSVAKADAYIALGKYSEAHELLQRIISNRSTESFEGICSVLRLNKVWRRDPDMLKHSRLTNNLASVVSLIKRQDSQVQEEYMNELQATVYHVKQLEKPVPSDLQRLIEDTLGLYKDDDVTLQKQRSALRMIIGNDDLDVPTFELAQVDQRPTETVRRKSYVSIEETTDSTHVNQDQYTNVQLEASYESDSESGRAYSDPFADSNTDARSLFGPTSITEDVHSQETERAWREKNLLALDGNGTHIYWSLLVLKRLMDLIGQEEKKQVLLAQRAWDAGILSIQPATYESELLEGTGPLPCYYFDLICSSSMGGFIALILGRYRRPIEECIFLYKQVLRDTFAEQASVLALTRSLLSQPAWDMTGAIKILNSLTHQGSFVRTVPGTCAVFIFACSQAENNMNERRPYLIRSYDHFVSVPEDGRRNPISVNSGRASGLDTSEAIQAATASPDTPKEIKIPVTPLGPPKSVYLSDSSDAPDRFLVALGFQEIKSLHGTEGVGMFVSIGIQQVLELKRQSETWTPYWDLATFSSEQTEIGPGTNMLSPQNYWRFSDLDNKEGINIGQREWKPSGITTRKHKMGSATLAKIDAAFDKWASQPWNEESLLKCARKLAERRRLRAANQERWSIYASGGSFSNPFEDETT